MPRRKHTEDDQLDFDLFQLFAFGSDEELLAGFGSLERAEEAWLEARDDFLARWKLWGMPQAWWRFEPDIPDELRRGPHAILVDDHADEWRRLEQARRRYLVSRGIDPTG